MGLPGNWVRFLDQRYKQGAIAKIQQQVAQLLGSASAMDANQGGVSIRIRKITLPLITLLGSNVQNIVWSRVMPQIPASDQVYIDYSTILGSGTSVASNLTRVGLTVTTTASLGGISAGAQLLVIAWNE